VEPRNETTGMEGGGKERPWRISALEKGNRIDHRVFLSGPQLDVLHVVSRRNRRRDAPCIGAPHAWPQSET
jgi:hypothetical protein